MSALWQDESTLTIHGTKFSEISGWLRQGKFEVDVAPFAIGHGRGTRG